MSKRKAVQQLALATCLTSGISVFAQAQGWDAQREQGAIPASPWNHRTSLDTNRFVSQPANSNLLRQPRPIVVDNQTGNSSVPYSATPLPSNTKTEIISAPPAELVPLSPRNPKDSGPSLMPPVPTPTAPMSPGVELHPAYPDGRDFTFQPMQGKSPHSGMEFLPRTGLILASESHGGLPQGLPDRNTSHSAIPNSPFLPQERIAQNEDWISENQRAAWEQRNRIGKLVSEELLKDAESPIESRPTAIEPPSGWNALEKELKARLQSCDEMLRRGAVYSGKQEAIVAIRLLLRQLDQRRSQWISEPFFDQALAAFKEESEFHRTSDSPDRSLDVEEIVRGHSTPVLKGCNLAHVPPAIAAQHYQHFAKDRLIAAAERHPWAADLFYAFGKCLEKQAVEATSESEMLLGQAAICYQAALASRSQHAEAANQLGFVLLKLDRCEEAQMFLAHSVQVRPSIEAYQNLIELYRRRGNQQGIDWASNQAIAMRKSQTNPRNLPRVHEVDPGTFATMSPRFDWNNVQPMTNPSVQTPPAQAAQKSSSWFGRMFR